MCIHTCATHICVHISAYTHLYTHVHAPMCTPLHTHSCIHTEAYGGKHMKTQNSVSVEVKGGEWWRGHRNVPCDTEVSPGASGKWMVSAAEPFWLRAALKACALRAVVCYREKSPHGENLGSPRSPVPGRTPCRSGFPANPGPRISWESSLTRRDHRDGLTRPPRSSGA